MPIHKVGKHSYKWGSRGATFPSREGAERQAAAAYAHGYQGKAQEELLQTDRHTDPGGRNYGGHPDNPLSDPALSAKDAPDRLLEQVDRAISLAQTVANPTATTLDRAIRLAEDVARR